FVVGFTPSVFISLIFSVKVIISVICSLYIAASSSVNSKRTKSAVLKISSFVIFAILVHLQIYKLFICVTIFLHIHLRFHLKNKEYNTHDNSRNTTVFETILTIFDVFSTKKSYSISLQKIEWTFSFMHVLFLAM